MDRAVIDRKIESLRRCLARIQSKAPKTPVELASDLDAQDIISVNLERAVQLCVDIASHILGELNVDVPDTMADSFSALQKAGIISDGLCQSLRKAIGFRNIAVHDYAKVDWAKVHSIATKDLGDFKSFIKQIDEWLNK